MGDNDRTAWILVGFMVVTFIFFTLGIIGLAFGEQLGWFTNS